MIRHSLWRVKSWNGVCWIQDFGCSWWVVIVLYVSTFSARDFWLQVSKHYVYEASLLELTEQNNIWQCLTELTVGKDVSLRVLHVSAPLHHYLYIDASHKNACFSITSQGGGFFIVCWNTLGCFSHHLIGFRLHVWMHQWSLAKLLPSTCATTDHGGMMFSHAAAWQLRCHNNNNDKQHTSTFLVLEQLKALLQRKAAFSHCLFHTQCWMTHHATVFFNLGLYALRLYWFIFNSLINAFVILAWATSHFGGFSLHPFICPNLKP